jgi:hypothetical protein
MEQKEEKIEIPQPKKKRGRKPKNPQPDSKKLTIEYGTFVLSFD